MVFAPLKTFAVYGLSETADIIPAGHYRFGASPQMYLGNGGGADAAAYLDMNLGADLNARAEVGSGSTDFWGGGSVKWSPYPDYENQPAIAFRGKVFYMRDSDINLYNFQAAAIISKKYETAEGVFVPFAGIPLTYVYEKNSNTFTVSRLCFGSEWIVTPDFQAGTELGIDLSSRGSNFSSTATTLALYFNFQFDEKIGFKK